MKSEHLGITPLSSQQVASGDTGSATRNLAGERHPLILNRFWEGQARFRVLRQPIAHAKLYVLEGMGPGRTRDPIRLANFSDTRFGGRQSASVTVRRIRWTSWRTMLCTRRWTGDGLQTGHARE